MTLQLIPPLHPQVLIDNPTLTLKESDQQKKMKEDAWDAFEAYLFLRACDQTKYGSFMKGLQTSFSLGTNQYPKKLSDAVDALGQHRFDQKYHDNRKREAEKRRQQNTDQTPTEQPPIRSTSFAQTQRPPRSTPGLSNAICHACGLQGHISRDCPKINDIPPDQWYVRRAISALQDRDGTPGTQHQDTDPDDDDSTIQSTRSVDTNALIPPPSTNRRSGTPGRQRSRVGWQNFQFFNMMTNPVVDDPAHLHTQSPQCDKPPANVPSKTSDSLKNVIILDTGSSIPGTFANPDLVRNVRPAKQKIGMQTNAGHSVLDVQADVPDFGSVYYDNSHVANIFGFAHLVDNVDYITYDSRLEDAFHVHTTSGKTTFARTDQNLYAYQPKRGYLTAIAESKHMVPPPM